VFRKVLIANRGEIAVRIIRALRELGIRSVAVFSEVDRGALHVRMADEAAPVGRAESSASYLNSERILDAARRHDAEAIHPGYGFLSENADFAAACEQARICLHRPLPAAIRTMG
jgi:acetyl/propionyl-CoA carboxylase alpha subunit